MECIGCFNLSFDFMDYIPTECTNPSSFYTHKVFVKGGLLLYLTHSIIVHTMPTTMTLSRSQCPRSVLKIGLQLVPLLEGPIIYH